MSTYSVYVVRCSDGTLYTGVAQDVPKRIKEHNFGGVLGAKYTRSRTPVLLVYKEDGYTQGEALSREYAVKQLSRMEKEKLIRPRKTTVKKRVV